MIDIGSGTCEGIFLPTMPVVYGLIPMLFILKTGIWELCDRITWSWDGRHAVRNGMRTRIRAVLVARYRFLEHLGCD